MQPCVLRMAVKQGAQPSKVQISRLAQRTLRGFRRPARRGTAVRAACSRWLHRCCGRLRPYCTPSWRHSRVQQRLGRTAPRYYIIRGPGKVHGGAGGGGSVVVGTKAHLSAIHRRSFPSLKAGIEALVDERDVASSFVPGHCSRRKQGTAKYISLHLSYRRPGVQPPPVRLSSTLAPAK